MLLNYNENNKIKRVEPVGSKEAKIALVGEAPGRSEIVEGKPFVGPAGNLLNQLLQNAGILRSDCYITNVVKEQPPKTSKKANDISVFVDLSKKAPIETPEYKKYIEELREELERTEANIFVAFGNVSLYALTGIFPPKITKRRGSIYESTLVPGRKVIASIHPAACLYKRGSEESRGGMYMWRYFILRDLSKAVEESKDRIVKRPNVEYIIKPSFAEAKDFLEKIKDSAKQVAFDIEVVNLEVSCISLAIRRDGVHSMSIPFVFSGREYMTPYQEAEIWNLIAGILEDESINKVGQNLVFDTQFLFRKYGIVTRNMNDTMIAEATLVPDFPKGLDFITSIYTDEPYYKDEGKKYFKMTMGDENFALYNAKDSAMCVLALPRQMNELKRLGNVERYDRQKRLIPILVYMSERGIRIDTEGLGKKSDETGERIEELKEALNKLCGFEINPSSPPQLMNYFYTIKGYKPYTNRATGNQTTDVDALKRLARKGAPEASILLEIRRLSKLKSTYLDTTLDEDNRLRCSFDPVGAADSGRLSSRKTIWDTGMDIQNIPSEFKEFMLFDDGYIGYEIDLSQAENRIVAYIAPEPTMIEALESGVDIHAKTASLIFNKPIEEVTSELGTCPICEDPTTCGHKGERFWGKKTNHAFNYGLGPIQFAYALGIEAKVGKAVRAAYLNAYPGILQYWQWVQEELRKSRTLTNPFNTHRLFMDRWGEGLFKEAYSWIPQSTVADKVNEDGLIEIYYNQDRYKEVELLNQVHDSIVFQIPINVGLRRHAEILLSIKRSLEKPISWRGREFVIPCGLTMGKTNMKSMKEIEWTDNVVELAERLR